LGEFRVGEAEFERFSDELDWLRGKFKVIVSVLGYNEYFC